MFETAYQKACRTRRQRGVGICGAAHLLNGLLTGLGGRPLDSLRRKNDNKAHDS